MRHLVYVTLILVMIIMTGCVAYVGLTHLPEGRADTSAYLGSISSVDAVSNKEMRLTFGYSTTGLDFDRCKMVIFAPDNLEITTIHLEKGKWSYMTKGDHFTLTTVTILDMDNDSELDAGDGISLFHTKPLEQGGWTLRMFVDGSDKASLEEVFAMPSNVTPTGAFRVPQMTNDREMFMQFGIFDSVIPLYQTTLVITTPDGQEQGWMFQMGAPSTFSFNDTIWMSVVDMEQQHIIDYGDQINIQSTLGPLPEGDWNITLLYDYTEQAICHVDIHIEDGKAVIV